MSPIMVDVSEIYILELGNILVYHHLPKKRLSLRTPPLLIIYYFATVQHPDDFSIVIRENKNIY